MDILNNDMKQYLIKYMIHCGDHLYTIVQLQVNIYWYALINRLLRRVHKCASAVAQSSFAANYCGCLDK